VAASKPALSEVEGRSLGMACCLFCKAQHLIAIGINHFFAFIYGIRKARTRFTYVFSEKPSPKPTALKLPPNKIGKRSRRKMLRFYVIARPLGRSNLNLLEVLDCLAFDFAQG